MSKLSSGAQSAKYAHHREYITRVIWPQGLRLEPKTINLDSFSLSDSYDLILTACANPAILNPFGEVPGLYWASIKEDKCTF